MIHFNQPNYSAVGASGAVTGILFSLYTFPSIELMIFFIPIPIPGYIFGIGYILYIYGIEHKTIISVILLILVEL